MNPIGLLQKSLTAKKEILHSLKRARLCSFPERRRALSFFCTGAVWILQKPVFPGFSALRKKPMVLQKIRSTLFAQKMLG